MSAENNSDSSTSESEVTACSSNFNPMKALYSSKATIPDKNAPMYNTLQQFEKAQDGVSIIPVGQRHLVIKEEQKKAEAKLTKERELEEKNKLRFSRFEGLTTVPRKERKVKNILTRLQNLEGPLSALKDCVDQRLRVKVVTRNATGIRGYMHGTLVAFDKQWNLALTDVLEVWQRKGVKKRKVPPGLGEPVPKGTAATISTVPQVTETPLGSGVWECTRHIPQLMVRGEHVVLINIVER